MKNIVNYICVGFLGLLFALTCFFNLGNQETPAGYVGYVTRGAIFGHTHFVGLQEGPTSTGLTWKPGVINVSITPSNTQEDFQDFQNGHKEGVIASDNLKIQYSVHVVWQVDPKQVKDYVENYTHLLKDISPEQKDADQKAKIDSALRVAYENNLQSPIRSYAREEVAKYGGLDIQNHMGQIAQKITERANTLVQGTPFRIISINLGNPAPPQDVLDAMAERSKKLIDLEQAKTEAQIADKDKQKTVAEAKGIAAAMAALNSKLTDSYLDYESVESNRAMVKAPNHNVIYAPRGTNTIVNIQKP